jgi:hypothetical protein
VRRGRTWGRRVAASILWTVSSFLVIVAVAVEIVVFIILVVAKFVVVVVAVMVVVVVAVVLCFGRNRCQLSLSHLCHIVLSQTRSRHQVECCTGPLRGVYK